MKVSRPHATLSISQQTLQLHKIWVLSFDALHWTKATSIAPVLQDHMISYVGRG